MICQPGVLHASTSLMGNIIEARRIEDFPGFSIEYAINGVNFVKYNASR
jgi:hypothetical protein